MNRFHEILAKIKFDRRAFLLASLATSLSASFSLKTGFASELNSFFGETGQFIEMVPKTPIPDAKFTDIEGRSLAISDFEGRVVLVNIWATWCPPCVREMPALDRLEADFGGKDFHVIPISIDEEGASVVVPFFKNHGLTSLPIYLDPQQRAVHFNSEEEREDTLPIYGLPISFFVDRDGKLLGYLAGAVDWDSEEPREFISNLIQE